MIGLRGFQYPVGGMDMFTRGKVFHSLFVMVIGVVDDMGNESKVFTDVSGWSLVSSRGLFSLLRPRIAGAKKLEG